jgi:hypothetical protein
MITNHTYHSNSIKKNNSTNFLTRLLVICLLVSAGGTLYFYQKYNALRQNPNLEESKKASDLIGAIGRLIELPQGETPTIATILDKDKLKGQPFFQMSENGDKLLAYNTAMIAILYRPSINKIINVAPISLSQPQDTTIQEPNKSISSATDAKDAKSAPNINKPR